MNSEKNGDFKGSEPRNSNPLSSPDSESISIVDEKDKIERKVESSLEENSSEESTASSLKRRLRELPSPSESSPFCEGSVVSSRLLRKERDFFYHLQELSNSIEEKDEAEVSSASSETRISSAISSKLQNPRIRRRVKIMEASRNQSSNFSSKFSTDSDRDSVSKSSRGSSMKTMIPKIENREDSELSQNSSRYGDSSGGKLESNIDFLESGKLSSRSNLTSSGERNRRPLYRTNLKNDVMTSPLSPLSPLNFAGTFPILSKSNNINISKKVGGYRPASVLLCNLSSESDSDTGNDKILQNLMIERLKTREKLAKLQSRVNILTNPESSTESNSSSAKFKERNFLSKKEGLLNSKENSARVSENESKIDSDFEEILQNQRLEKTILSRDPVSTFSTPRQLNTDINQSFISNPTSTRSDPSEIDRRVSRIPSFVCARINLEENSPYSAKSVIRTGRSEINFRRKNSSLREDKKLRVPALKIRSQDLSPLGRSKEKENQQSLDMKALVTALSDVSLKQENAYGDSGKYRSDRSENRKFQTRLRSSYSKTQLSSNSRSSSFQKIPTRIPEGIIASPNESTKNISQKSISTPINIEKSRNFLYEKKFPDVSRFEKSISTSRIEYPEVKSSHDKRSVRSFEFTSSDLKIAKDENCFFDLKMEELSSESILNTQNDFDESISKVMEEAEMHPKNFSSENHFPINEDCDLSSINEKSENGGNNEEILSDGFSSKPSSTNSHHHEQNDLEMEISSTKKISSTFKLDPITFLKTPDNNFAFVSPFQDSESLKPKTSDNPHAFILPRNMKEKLLEGSNQFEENLNDRKLDRLFPDLTKEKVHIQSVDEFQSRENQQMAQNQSDKEVIPDDSLINHRMFESSMGDSNQQVQGRWGYRRNIEQNYPRELTEPHYQKPKIVDLRKKNCNGEFEKDIKGQAVNLIERSAFFNSMKQTKSDSTAILSRESTDTNLPAKSSSSMSKLTYLLESMKKETQDRYPFTISESESRNSSKFKVENEQDCTKETLPKLEEPEEIAYKLDIHPSITRLALSGTEPLPSELINCASYESPSQGRNFLPRMRNYIRRFSNSLKKKKSKNSKSELTKILFKNSECRLESAGSSGDTMELQFLAEEIEEAKVSSTSRGPPGNPKIEIFSENSLQRFDSETESSRIAEVKISRAKSSPIDIKTPRPRFSRLEEPEFEDFGDIRFEEKSQKPKETPEKKKPSPDKEVSSVNNIKVEVHERPSQIEAESSCFCFQLCRALAQPSVGSPGNVYLSSKRSKHNPSNKKKPYFSTVDNKGIC